MLGGGPSLPEQFKRAPKGYKFSINQHGVILTTCDVALALDRPPVFHIRQAQPGIPVMHPRNDLADIQLTEFWHAGNSTMSAIWVADYMGFGLIIPMGIDMYSGGTYWWDTERHVSGCGASAEAHIDSWAKVKKNVPGWRKIRVMGGPLTEIFPLYDPTEGIPDVPSEPLPKPPTNTRYIHALANTRAGNMTVEQGGCYWVHMDHAYTLVSMGKAEYVDPPVVEVKKAVKKKAKKAKA